jgi:pimeloyl-ACP methyl ester carboxylesterase
MIVPLSAVWAVAHGVFRALGFRSRKLHVGLHEAHVYERPGRGKGPPVLLVHGMGGNAAGFLPILRRLVAESRRVVLLELPGHGRARLGGGTAPASMVECGLVLHKALEEMGEPAVLIGSSLGGALALAIAAQDPALVAGVVGLNPAGAPLEGEARLTLVHAFRGGSVRAALEMNRRLFARPPRSAWWVARGLAGHWSSAAVQQFVGELQSDVKGIPPEALRSIRAPLLILWGDADGLLPASFPEYFARHLPAGSVERLAGVGHLPMQERAGAVARRLARFLRELPA